MKKYKDINPRLLANIFKGIVLYSVEEKTNGYFDIKRYIPRNDKQDFGKGYLNVREVDENLNVKKEYSKFKKLDDLYISFIEAKEIKRKYNNMISKFDFRPYMKIEMIEEHFEELMFIQGDIHKKLKGYENFLGIDFCNVGANGIQIRGHHKDIKGFTYGKQPTIKYDFSNIKEAISEFVNMWFEYDCDEYISREKDIIAFGEKYGWD